MHIHASLLWCPSFLYSLVNCFQKKKPCNRASQEHLTKLNKGFPEDQKAAAAEMGMQALMDVRCTNLVNTVCGWLGEMYDPASREFFHSGTEGSLWMRTLFSPFWVSPMAEWRCLTRWITVLRTIPLSNSLGRDPCLTRLLSQVCWLLWKPMVTWSRWSCSCT